MIRAFRSHALPCRGFTLIEMLAVVAVLAILLALAMGAFQNALEQARLTKSLSNIRNVGGALLMYVHENRLQLPTRAVEPDRSKKWPALIYQYLNNPDVYLDPRDAARHDIRESDIVSGSGSNRSSYLINGFNDLGALDDPELQVSLVRINTPADVILMGKKNVGKGDYYMDVDEGGGNHIEVLDWETYGRKANFFYADGSARSVTQEQYDPEMWLVDKDYQIKQ